MADGDGGRRVAVKRQPWTRDAAARRQATLLLQRQARRDLTAHARRLAGGEDDGGAASQSEDEDAMEVVRGAGASAKRRTREERVKQRRERFCRQLMVPEWMVDVPRDLNGNGSAIGEGWYVLPRPEGKRCLVVASSGRTIARIQSGSVLRKFPSALPGGSHKTNRGNDAYCILDCIFQEQNSTFFVLDVMCWKSYLLYNCTTEFRWYWMRDKLSEGSTSIVAPANPYRFMPIPCFESDPEGIQSAYSATFPFIKDGLLFYMKAAHYEMDLSPLALVWKDHHTSRYHVFTEKPSIVLRLDEAHEFTTLEGIALYTPDEAFLKQHEFSEGDLAKFTFDEFEPSASQRPHLRGLTFVKRCSPQRALADSWTKILFQYNARVGGVQISQILEVAQSTVVEADMTG